MCSHKTSKQQPPQQGSGTSGLSGDATHSSALLAHQAPPLHRGLASTRLFQEEVMYSRGPILTIRPFNTHARAHVLAWSH